MNQQILQELFVNQLRDIYDAEKQLVKALPALERGAESEELATALRNHLDETRGQVSRIEKVFSLLSTPAKAKPCKAMKGLVEEGSEQLKELKKGELRDLAIIAAAQRVEHYEISAYGTARTLAEHLGMNDAAQLLRQTEDEEKKADTTLSQIAMSIYETGEEEEEMESEIASAESARSSRHPGTHTTKPKTRSAG